MRISVWLVLVCAAAMSLLSVPAHAQSTHTWVSGVGDDVNPCSRTAPCKTFAGAISKTTVAGEISVLDPGGFGAVTITKAITISSEGFGASVLVSGTNGVVVAAGPTDTVILTGLDIEGLGTGINGIRFLTGKQLYVIKCKIHHFTTWGIDMENSTSGARMVVKDSLITQNGGVSTGGGINVSGTDNGAVLVDTVIDGNPNSAVSVNGAGNAIAAERSQLTASTTGINLTNGGLATSIGQQNFVNGAGAFTSDVAYK
jgi:hypothetical protein